MIYPRKLKSYLVRELDTDYIIVVTGMRRVGKTFLLQDLYNGISSQNKVFLDLEKLEYRAIFTQDSYDAIIKHFK